MSESCLREPEEEEEEEDFKTRNEWMDGWMRTNSWVARQALVSFHSFAQ